MNTHSLDERIFLYDSKKRKRVLFKPQEKDKLKFYSCGPTTYDFLHVGNARALVVGDLIFRVFLQKGYDVTFVRNFTDIDDKIIKKANERGIDAKAHAEEFIDECLKDMGSLNLLPPTHAPLATEHIEGMIDIIKELVGKGFAYERDGEVLFNVKCFEDYGKLSGRSLDELMHGIRVQVDEHKINPADFVLWKPAKKGEPSFESPWGAGRPGWHIECSAMNKALLGETIDLHHGGVDLLFPHHENEVAQSEASCGKTFCHFWVHNEFLHMGQDKMSKSLGNVVTIRHFVENYGGLLLRYILLKNHYRTVIKWGEDLVEQSITELTRLAQLFADCATLKDHVVDSPEDSLKAKCDEWHALFDHQLGQDFNTPLAFNYLFSLARLVNKLYFKGSEWSASIPRESFESLKAFLLKANNTLGIIKKEGPHVLLSELNEARGKLKGADVAQLTPEEIEGLIEERKKAREEKNWARADEVRKILQEKNVQLEDRPDGSTLWKYG